MSFFLTNFPEIAFNLLTEIAKLQLTSLQVFLTIQIQLV